MSERVKEERYRSDYGGCTSVTCKVRGFEFSYTYTHTHICTGTTTHYSTSLSRCEQNISILLESTVLLLLKWLIPGTLIFTNGKNLTCPMDAIHTMYVRTYVGGCLTMYIHTSKLLFYPTTGIGCERCNNNLLASGHLNQTPKHQNSISRSSTGSSKHTQGKKKTQ